MTRRSRFVALVAFLALVVAVAVGSFFAFRSEPRPAAAPESPPAPTTLQATFVPVTGIRSGAPTIVSGSVVNLTDTALDAGFTVSGLPQGATLTSVLPSISTPRDGLAWSCMGPTCVLVGATGTPQQLPSKASMQVMLQLDAASVADPAATVTVTSIAGAAISVPLSLPDGAPALSTDAIIADLSGPSLVRVGQSAAAIVRVSNLSSIATNSGPLSVAINPPGIEGLTVQGGGAGWQCSSTLCTSTAAIAPFETAPILTLTLSASSTALEGSGSLAIVASTAVGGTSVTSSATMDIAVHTPSAQVVSTRLDVDEESVAAPATVNLSAVVTATGLANVAQVSSPVSLALTVPSGLEVDWNAVTIDGPWSCSDEANGCTSTGPLTAGVPTTATIPVSVPSGFTPGTQHLVLETTVGQGDSSTPQRSSTATVVVVPPPVSELRAVLQNSTDSSDPVARNGDALTFAAGQARSLSINVINEGSVSLVAGQYISVTATPDSSQRLALAGGNGWSCRQTANVTLKPSSPLRCLMKLSEDLPAGEVLQIPMTLEPTGLETSNWTVTVDSSSKSLSDVTTHTQVSVSDVGPFFAASIVSDSPLYNGGSGTVTIAVANHGDSVAYGGVVVIQIPEEADLIDVASPAWTCLDAALDRANGTLTCVTSTMVQPSISAASITLELATHAPTTEVELSVWASATGQYESSDSNPVVSSKIPVAGSLVIDAGQDLTVVTPQLAPDGTEQPAVVTLTGAADLATAAHLKWTQRCLQPGDPECDGNVTPTVTWNGVPAGQTPTTETATFTAPSQITVETALVFQLTGQVGKKVISDLITVHLLPASIGSAALTGTGNGPNANGGGVDSGPTPSSPPTTAQPSADIPPSAFVASSGTLLQVPTLAQGQLVGTGTGTGTLTFAWEQTAGPTADLIGASANQSTLLFTAPLLDPDEQSTTLTFQLTVTDSTGATATAEASVQVVWGDDGLQVVIANGAENVVTTVDAPVAIASQVTSRGAPYTYEWSIDGLDLPSGTATDQSSLSFQAGDQPTNATTSLTVTDSFERVTTVSVPLIVSGLPSGQVPIAFCNALRKLTASQPAQLAGEQVQVTIESASVSGQTTPTCTQTSTATIRSARVGLPGGVSISDVTGELTVAGLTISGGAVTVPANWSVTAPVLGTGGLFLPFVSTSSLGDPTGSITATGAPFFSFDGWAGTTTVTFTASPNPVAVFNATAAPSSGTGSLQVNGTSSGGATKASMTASGLVGIGAVDLPLAGTITTSSASSPVDSVVDAGLRSPTALGAGITITAASMNWTPTSSTGPVSLALGTGPSALTLQSIATVTSNGTQFTVAQGSTGWNPAPGFPSLQLFGTGSVQDSQLVLALTSSSVAGPVANDLAVSALQGTLSANCPLDGSQSCVPIFALSANASSPLFSGSVPLSGSIDWVNQVSTLSGSIGTITIAPLSLTNSTIEVALSPTMAPVVIGSGGVSGYGATGNASIDFGPTATVASVPLGTQTLISGWTIPAVNGYATNVATTQTLATNSLATPITVPLAVGQLTAVGVTQLPNALAQGVIPADVANAVAVYIANGSPLTDVTLIAPVPQGWYLVGDADSTMSLQMNTIGFDVQLTGSSATIAVSGTGTYLSDGLVAQNSGPNSAVSVPMTFSGTLSTGSTGAALSGTFTPSSSSTWSKAFGINGLTLTNDVLTVSMTAAQTSVTMNATTSLPATLAQSLGVPPTATPNLTLVLDADQTCAVIDLASGGSPGVNIGGTGLLVTSSASLVIAPDGCSVNGTQVPAGFVLVMDGGLLGPVTIPLDPTTFATIGSAGVTATSMQVGGLSLSSASISFTFANGGATIDVAGTATIDGVDVQLSGTATPPATLGGIGSLVLSGSLPSMSLAEVQLSSVNVTATSAAIIGSGSTTVVLSGSLPVLGVPTAVSMTGVIQSGVIDSLMATLPSTTYRVAIPQTTSSDVVVAAFALDYTSINGVASFSIEATSATLTTTDYAFTTATITQTSSTQFSLSGTAPIASELEPLVGVTVSGSYDYAGSGQGAYSFTTPSSADSLIAGFSASTDVIFQRSSGTESAQQTVTLTPGLFDNGSSVTLSGALSADGVANLVGTASNQQMRGLTGDAMFSVSKNPILVAFPNLAASLQPWTYTLNVNFQTTGTSCDLWSGDPILTGQIYRSGATTYYTLAGEVNFGAPDGINLSALAVGGSQPLVLSNENSVNQQQTPTSGLSLKIGMNTGFFTASAQVSFDIANCSYSAGGIVQFIYGGGATGQQMSQALSPGNGIEENASSLFGSNGSLPQTIATLRTLMQTEQMQANYQTLANVASTALQTANNNVTQGQANVNEAQNEQRAAQNQVNLASENLQQQRIIVANAQSNVSNAQEQDILPFSEDVQTALTNLDSANANLAQATNRLATANATLVNANGRVQQTTTTLDDLTNDAQEADADNTAAQNSATQSQQIKVLVVTLDFTHCGTCTVQDSASIAGSLYFAEKYVIDASAVLDWISGSLSTIQITASFGEEFQENPNIDFAGVLINLQALITVSGTYDFSDDELGTVSISFTGSGDVQVYVSLYFTTLSTTLADVSLSGGIAFNPFGLTGSLYIDVLGVSGYVSF